MAINSIHLHSMVKNEELILERVIPVWKEYPVDKFVFLDDGSTDKTLEVIQDMLGMSAVVLHRPLRQFNEAANRQAMLDYSLGKANWVLSLDADEVLTSGFFDTIGRFSGLLATERLEVYCFNLCDGGNFYRQDPAYVDNYLTILFNINRGRGFNLKLADYHSSKRYPIDSKPIFKTNALGVIHLQSYNKRFYLLKQLWYKHYELVRYQRDAESINRQYDYVVNGGNFKGTPMVRHLAISLALEESLFTKIEESKGYLDFIKNHYCEELCTFGKEFLDI